MVKMFWKMEESSNSLVMIAVSFIILENWEWAFLPWRNSGDSTKLWHSHIIFKVLFQEGGLSLYNYVPSLPSKLDVRGEKCKRDDGYKTLKRPEGSRLGSWEIPVRQKEGGTLIHPGRGSHGRSTCRETFSPRDPIIRDALVPRILAVEQLQRERADEWSDRFVEGTQGNCYQARSPVFHL